MVPLFNRVLSWTTAFARSRRGNVAIIFALTLLPITFLIGMVINYSEASQKQVILDAAADAAALAAVDYQAMTQSASTAQTIAQNVFNAQTANIPGLTNTNLTVTVQNSGLGRTALISYQAQSTNVFPGIFKNNWSISGSSQAASAIPPRSTSSSIRAPVFAATRCRRPCHRDKDIRFCFRRGPPGAVSALPSRMPTWCSQSSRT